MLIPFLLYISFVIPISSLDQMARVQKKRVYENGERANNGKFTNQDTTYVCVIWSECSKNHKKFFVPLLLSSNSIPWSFQNVCICNQMYIYIKEIIEMDLRAHPW